jgi:Zn-dependent peptidase ImmA (M78 family)
VQENFTSQKCKTGEFDKTDIEEYKADLFSMCLLLPSTGVRQLIPMEEMGHGKHLSLQTILLIEHFFSVSRKAVIHRLISLGFLDNKTAIDLFSKDIKKGAAQNGYPLHLYEPGNENEIIGDYGVLANSLLQTQQISESHYIELMGAIGFNPFDQQREDDESERG